MFFICIYILLILSNLISILADAAPLLVDPPDASLKAESTPLPPPPPKFQTRNTNLKHKITIFFLDPSPYGGIGTSAPVKTDIYKILEEWREVNKITGDFEISLTNRYDGPLTANGHDFRFWDDEGQAGKECLTAADDCTVQFDHSSDVLVHPMNLHGNGYEYPINPHNPSIPVNPRPLQPTSSKQTLGFIFKHGSSNSYLYELRYEIRHTVLKGKSG
ncbi:hypothetical protein J3R30DRAFT_170369 [Lentinula aciculospora]|uniref:Uncharacterized protein n=1 Tax=Lentinula aciculospora TaxID=153920 RepID=A0A9W9DNB9_9AGAR|nr:hypothetical protein J3R30DRAFT_170369 [Lentinula aciculospora]